MQHEKNNLMFQIRVPFAILKIKASKVQAYLKLSQIAQTDAAVTKYSTQ